jgi:putative holliday junction resolvase
MTIHHLPFTIHYSQFDEIETPLPQRGKVMALDLGDRRIGVAVSDGLRMIASGYSVFERTSRATDFAHIQELVAAENITLLVMGLPTSLSGEDSPQTAWVRDYTADLQNHLDIPIIFWDESLTTKQAEASLRARGKRGRQIKERVDAVAAAFILQSYLDATYGM